MLFYKDFSVQKKLKPKESTTTTTTTTSTVPWYELRRRQKQACTGEKGDNRKRATKTAFKRNNRHADLS